MRVLHAMAGAANGGAEAFFERLTVSLHQRGIEQRLLVKPVGGRAERLRDVGLNVTTVPFRQWADWPTRQRWQALIAQFQPTIQLLWMNRAASKAPLVPGCVNIGRLGGYYALKNYRRCTYLIGNTPDIVRYCRAEGWPETHAVYLPNFPAPAVVTAPLPHMLEKRQQGYVNLLALGRYHPNKAFDVLLQALAAVPKAFLWLVGDGEEKLAYQQLATTLQIQDRVAFVPWVQDTAPWLAGCDMLVCPSRHEPLGNVVLEGWAFAKPVVACAAQGPLFLIKHGENGLLATLDDAADLAAQLNACITNAALAAAIAAGGAESHRLYYSRDAVTAQFIDFFQRLSPL